MRQAVLGAGGVGGIVGGALAKAGHPVTLLVRPGRRDPYPELLSVQSEPLENFEAPVRVADRLDEQFDIVWIAVKVTLESALSTIAPPLLGRIVVLPNRGADCGPRGSDRHQGYCSRGEESQVVNDALIEEINAAYRRLSATTEDLASADRQLAEYVLRVRLDNAEAILEAKNERTASLYLDGLLDTHEHRRLEADRGRADLDLQHARREVERLHLIVRLLGTRSNEGIPG
jgi:predicted dinucleotide-binding enzyme